MGLRGLIPIKEGTMFEEKDDLEATKIDLDIKNLDLESEEESESNFDVIIKDNEVRKEDLSQSHDLDLGVQTAAHFSKIGAEKKTAHQGLTLKGEKKVPKKEKEGQSKDALDKKSVKNKESKEAVLFETLGLSEVLLKALKQKGFEQCSDIQAAAIPFVLSSHKDMIGQAQTGTGKTAAFGLPLLDLIEPNQSHVQALVLTPTRELTIQVTDELYSLKGAKALKITPVYGGQSIETQRQQLKKSADIVVGTPGRLIDHIKSKNLDLSKIDFLVLDEADEMLNGGFIEDIEYLMEQSNPSRRTLLFSATMSDMVMDIAKKHMKAYEVIKAKKKTLATTLTEQLYFEVRESDKLEALCRIIDVEDQFYGLIFCRTKRDVDTISERLIHRGYEAEAMHGDLSQFQRERVLNKFRKQLCRILVVTDVASRGLDISGLSHVINYALPQDAESYVHRVGRTGRAGQTGTAITFITPSEFRKLTYIKKVSKTEIKKKDIPTVQDLLMTKQRRLKLSIQERIEQQPKAETFDFAEALLATYSPKEALAGVLSVAFESLFSKDQYQDIKPVKGKGEGRHENRGDRRRDGRGRESGRDGQGSQGRRDRGPRRREGDFVDAKGKMRLFVAKGKLDGFHAGSLVSFVSEKSGVPKQAIQGADVYDKFSFINVSFSDAEHIIRSFKPRDGEKRSLIAKAK